MFTTNDQKIIYVNLLVFCLISSKRTTWKNFAYHMWYAYHSLGTTIRS